tara:strand:+ start:1269 stop:1403 length:135 start_codon:yes stop_codon:yes gene_type:complete
MSTVLTIISIAVFSLAMGHIVSKEVEQLRKEEESIFLNKLREMK